jgi:AraC family transcriptional regulator
MLLLDGEDMHQSCVRQHSLMPDCGLYGVESVIVDYERNLQQSAHRHDHGSITLILRGSLEEDLPNNRFVAGPLVMLTKAPGTRHSDAYGAVGCRTLQVNFSKSFEFGTAKHNALCSSRHEGGPAVAALLQLIQMAMSDFPGRSDAILFLLYEALAALSTECPDAIAPTWLVRTKSTIDASTPTTRWTVVRLSREAGMHPVHLTKQFHRHYGRTIREYLKLRRLYAAAAAVAQGHRSLSSIAHAFGYADQAHFCRAFRAVARVPASQYRHLLGGLNQLTAGQTPKAHTRRGDKS